MRAAAATLKKISLELGGKSPNIFFADSDFDVAVEGALFGVFFNQGEVCTAGSRILVQRPIYKKFVDAMVEKAKSITVGLPMDRTTKMGAIVSREQFDRVRRCQKSASRKRKWRRAAAAPRRRARRRMSFSRRSSTMWTTPPASHARDLRPGRVRDPLRYRGGRAADRQRHLLRPGRAAVWTRDIFRAMRVVKSLRAGIIRSITCSRPMSSAMGRLQAERHRPRTGQMGRRGISQHQTGLHQPF